MNEFVLRPSNAKRWLACPASAILEQRAEKEVSLSKWMAANEGTAAHTVLELCVKGMKSSADHLLGTTVNVDNEESPFEMVFRVDQEMVDGVNMFLEHILGGQPGDVCEEEIIHPDVPELRGTPDFIRLFPNSLGVMDFKYGKGAVSARSKSGDINPQLMCYTALASSQHPHIETFLATIVQPRRATKKKILTTVITKKEVDLFMIRVGSIARKLRSLAFPEWSANLVTGGHCFWCKYASQCPAKKEAEATKAFLGGKK